MEAGRCPSGIRALSASPIKELATELAEKLRASTTVDWHIRESVRAKLRNLVRSLLRRYKYPPDDAAEAIELVMQQTEALAKVWSNEEPEALKS